MIISTTQTLEGMTITEYKGLVSGTAIHGVKVGKDIKALGRNIVGGRATAYEDEIGQGQAEASAEMEAAAAALGANAIVGVSLDLEAVGSNGSMLLVNVSGTAVVVSQS